jgi:transcriptional regulator with XRE-family HTH domain
MTKPTPQSWTRLRVIREKDGHSLTSLAKSAGMSVSYLSELESGKRTPNAGIIQKLAQALNVPLSSIEPYRHHDEPAA